MVMNEKKMVGKRSVLFSRPPIIIGAGSVAGEKEGVYPIALALSRKMGNREQRIIVLGDADCISNGEFGRRVPTARASNFSLITGGFFWMSDNEVPIDVRRPALPDNKVYVEKTGSKVIKWSFMIVLPLLLAGIGIFLWIRRKGR